MTRTLETPPDLSQLARDPAPAPFEVRGRPGIHVVVSVVAGVMALAYLWRAVDGGSPILWAMVAVLVGIAMLHLLGRREAALPRLVADEHGVRVRRRSQWTGLPWDEIDRVDVAAMHGPLGSTVVRLLRVDDEPMVVSCGASTRTSADDIVVALRALAPYGTPISRGVSPSTRALPRDEAEDEDESVEPEVAAAESGTRRAVRAEVTRTEPSIVGMIPLQPEPTVDRDSDDAVREDDTTDIEPVVDDVGPEPEPLVERAPAIRAEVDASIGPLLAAARFRLRLSVDELGNQTRIRPHVIESIENEDFGPCGGDFYARGHLRSLCRVLGVESESILRAFDRRYARAPIEAREVFEAELATGPRPTFRSIGRGANWVALLVVVMLLAIVWAVAKVVTDGDESGSGQSEVPSLSNAAEPRDDQQLADLGAPTVNELTLRGVGAGTRVTVKNVDREPVWEGRLRGGESHDVSVAGRAIVVADDGGAVRLRLNGDSQGRLGDSGEPTRVTVGHR